jgi:ATPase subunit of ABC transporter with duplicated ATPase domains
VTEVLEVGQGHAIRYLGNYDEYLEKKAQTDAAPSPSSQPTRSGPVQLRDTRGNNGNASRPKKAQPPKAAQPVKPGHPANDDRDALRKRERIARQRTQIEAGIEQRETERAALSAEMNDPNFYLARKDADDLIARYERLGREIEKLYADLVKFDEAASA